MFSSRALSVAILASIGLTDLAVSQDVITDAYFYGQSPAVYPSRKFLPQLPVYLCWWLIAIGSGTGDWATAYSKAAALVAQMTLDEKVLQQWIFWMKCLRSWSRILPMVSQVLQTVVQATFLLSYDSVSQACVSKTQVMAFEEQIS